MIRDSLEAGGEQRDGKVEPNPGEAPVTGHFLNRVLATHAFRLVRDVVTAEPKEPFDLALLDLTNAGVRYQPDTQQDRGHEGTVRAKVAVALAALEGMAGLRTAWPWSQHLILVAGSPGIAERAQKRLSGLYASVGAAHVRFESANSIHDHVEALRAALPVGAAGGPSSAAALMTHGATLRLNTSFGQRFLIELVARNRGESVGSVIREGVALLLDTTDGVTVAANVEGRL